MQGGTGEGEIQYETWIVASVGYASNMPSRLTVFLALGLTACGVQGPKPTGSADAVAPPVSTGIMGSRQTLEAVQTADATWEPKQVSDLLYVAAAQGNYESIRAIVATRDLQDDGPMNQHDLEHMVDTVAFAGRSSRAIEAGYGPKFSHATFNLVVARAYSSKGWIGSAKTYYRSAAESYESASSELSTRAQAANTECKREFLAELGNVVIPILAGAVAHTEAEMMVRQTRTFGIGIVIYPILAVDNRGACGAHYDSRHDQIVSRASYFSALQIYLIIQCYDQRTSAEDTAKCREMEKISIGE
jgi:hypothetical protein